MKKFMQRWLGLLILLVCVSGFAQSLPPIPEYWPLLEDFEFPTNFCDFDGYAPVKYTNIVSWGGESLALDRTNRVPAYLEYNVVETGGHTNLDTSVGTVWFLFAPNWASADTNQHGTGPGATAYFLTAGDAASNAPQGAFRIYANAQGTNLYFGGISNGVVTNYVSARISWASNSWHSIDVEYTPSNSVIFLDGNWVATGAPVSIVPGTNTWTNGMFFGSDAQGYEQMRGVNWWQDDWNIVFPEGELAGEGDSWSDMLAAANWWVAQQSGGFGGMSMMGGGLGSLNPTGSAPDYTNTGVYLTNMSAALVSGEGMTFSFTIEGGTNGLNYDVFSATNVVMPNITNTTWLWLGQGTNSGRYQVTNQPSTGAFYVLGTPVAAPDGSGLTVAYEALVHTNSSDTLGTPNAWYLGEGLNPQTSGIGTNDPDGDGLLNYQEYLYGSNPQASEGFAVWVSAPNGTSGIP